MFGMEDFFWRAFTIALYALAMWLTYSAISWVFNSSPVWVSLAFLGVFFSWVAICGVIALLRRR